MAGMGDSQAAHVVNLICLRLRPPCMTVMTSPWSQAVLSMPWLVSSTTAFGLLHPFLSVLQGLNETLRPLTYCSLLLGFFVSSELPTSKPQVC